MTFRQSVSSAPSKIESTRASTKYRAASQACQQSGYANPTSDSRHHDVLNSSVMLGQFRREHISRCSVGKDDFRVVSSARDGPVSERSLTFPLESGRLKTCPTSQIAHLGRGFVEG